MNDNKIVKGEFIIRDKIVSAPLYKRSPIHHVVLLARSSCIEQNGVFQNHSYFIQEPFHLEILRKFGRGYNHVDLSYFKV